MRLDVDAALRRAASGESEPSSSSLPHVFATTF